MQYFERGRRYVASQRDPPRQRNIHIPPGTFIQVCIILKSARNYLSGIPSALNHYSFQSLVFLCLIILLSFRLAINSEAIRFSKKIG